MFGKNRFASMYDTFTEPYDHLVLDNADSEVDSGR